MFNYHNYAFRGQSLAVYFVCVHDSLHKVLKNGFSVTISNPNNNIPIKYKIHSISEHNCRQTSNCNSDYDNSICTCAVCWF